MLPTLTSREGDPKTVVYRANLRAGQRLGETASPRLYSVYIGTCPTSRTSRAHPWIARSILSVSIGDQWPYWLYITSPIC